MAQDREAQVRQRAHAIWLDAGEPEGQSDQHWNQAEAEFDAEQNASTPAPAGGSDTGQATGKAVSSPVAGGVTELPEAPAVPVPPDVEAISAPSLAPTKPVPAKKTPPRRKTKPVTPIR